MRQLIRSYTYEAGVRNLEREIGAICRKVARRVAEGRPFPRVVRPALLAQYLGPAHRGHGVAELRDEIGVATGLSWTANGGDTMAIEVSVMEGKGALTLTGQLGEVMRESAQAALSFARANAQPAGDRRATLRQDAISIFMCPRAQCRRMGHRQGSPWRRR